jgi:hypothetical protein
MAFFEFRQNNSGGEFDVDENLCLSIYIEAEKAEEAKEKALDLGVYFDGVENGVDCECCGDRWYESDTKLDESNIMFLSRYDENKLDEILKIVGSNLVRKPGDSIMVGSVSRILSHFEIGFDTLSQKLKAQSILDTKWTSPMYRVFYKNGGVESIG